MRERIGVIGVAAVLVVSGCASDDPDASGGASPTGTSIATNTPSPMPSSSTPATSTAPLSASHRGVTPERIDIAIPIVDADTIQRDFSVELRWGDQRAKYEEAIAEVNDRGGVLGRRIDATFIEYVPITQDNTDDVCRQATEDLQVFAVVGFIRPDAGVLCLTELNDTPFVGGGDTPTEETRRRSLVPALYPGVSAARTDEALVEVMDQRDALDGRVIAVHGRDQGRLDAVEQALSDRGYTATTRTVLDAPESDALEMASQLDVIVERWRADGVEVVLNTTTNISMLSALARAGIEVDIATNTTDVALGPDAVFAQGATEAEVARVTLVSPAGSRSAYEAGHEPTVACIDRWNERHPDEVAVFDPADDELENLPQVVFACQNIELFVLVAEAAGPDLTTDSFAAALADLTDIELAGVPDGSLSEEKWDVNDTMAVAVWDPAAQDFEPTGEQYDIG